MVSCSHGNVFCSGFVGGTLSNGETPDGSAVSHVFIGNSGGHISKIGTLVSITWAEKCWGGAEALAIFVPGRKMGPDNDHPHSEDMTR